MIPQLNQIHIDTDSSSITSDSHGSMMMASGLSGPASFIHEDYIPSSGLPLTGSEVDRNDVDLSSHLLSLSLDQDEDDV